MPKTITVEIKCINPSCSSAVSFNPEQAFAPGTKAHPELRGWITVAAASQHAGQHDYLCPTCAAQLPAAALAVLRRGDEHTAHQAEQWMQIREATLGLGRALQGMAPPAAAPVLDDDGAAEPLPSGWSAANVETKLLGLFEAALNESGHDFERAARALLARYEATPDEQKRQLVEALAFAIVRTLSTIPPHIKSQFVTLALALHHAPSAAHIPAAPFQMRSNGVIHG